MALLRVVIVFMKLLTFVYMYITVDTCTCLVHVLMNESTKLPS